MPQPAVNSAAAYGISQRRRLTRYVDSLMYWPLLGGFVAFVTLALVLGRIVDPEPMHVERRQQFPRMPDAIKDSLAWIAVIVAGIGGYLVGIAAANSIPTTGLSSLSDFFTAAATVLGAVLIALALGATIADPASALAPVLLAVVLSVVVGLIASVVGLVPNISTVVSRQAFAVTTAAGLISLCGVLLVAFTAVFQPKAERLATWRRRLAESGIPQDADTTTKGGTPT